MDEFEVDFQQTTDAAEWAKAFIAIIQTRPEMALDEGFMIGWFANAMQIVETRVRGEARAIVDAQNRELRSLAYYLSHHCHRNKITPDADTMAILNADRSMLTFVLEHMVRIDSGEAFPTAS